MRVSADVEPAQPAVNVKKWARARRSGTHGLRRGAWYPVVAEPPGGLVVLGVRKDNVPVLRAHVEFSETEPGHWSVVQWDEKQAGARRASEQNYGLTYGVCPACSERVKLATETQRLACPDCGGEFPVDWEHPC